jgi:hypothetical protein
MSDNIKNNPLVAGIVAFALGAFAVVLTMLISNATHTGLAPAEILSGGLFGSAYLIFSPRYGVRTAVITVAMIAGALALYIGGAFVIIGGALATAAWIVSLWLMVATCQAFLRTK